MGFVFPSRHQKTIRESCSFNLGSFLLPITGTRSLLTKAASNKTLLDSESAVGSYPLISLQSMWLKLQSRQQESQVNGLLNKCVSFYRAGYLRFLVRDKKWNNINILHILALRQVQELFLVLPHKFFLRRFSNIFFCHSLFICRINASIHSIHFICTLIHCSYYNLPIKSCQHDKIFQTFLYNLCQVLNGWLQFNHWDKAYLTRHTYFLIVICLLLLCTRQFF